MEENRFNETLESNLSSPIPLLKKLRNLIFGEDSPEVILQVSVYINLIFWFIFQLWHLISYFAISYRDIILSEKKINVEILILNRGAELGFDPAVFLENLLTFHKIAIFFWLVVFVGIVMMWRKHRFYLYFLYIPLILHPLTEWYLLGSKYLMEDSTFFDKLSFFILLVNSIFYSIMVKQQTNQGADFFQTED